VLQTTNRSKGKGSAQRDPLLPNTINTLTTQKTQTRVSDDETRTRVIEEASKRNHPNKHLNFDGFVIKDRNQIILNERLK